jgi:uncharacterized protein (DUF305 family)
VLLNVGSTFPMPYRIQNVLMKLNAIFRMPMLAIAIAASVAAVGCSPQASPPSDRGAATDNADPQAGNRGGNRNADNAITLGPQDDTIDLRFIDGMIPHRRGAIAMAREALEKSERSEIRTFAQTLMDTQRQDMRQLRNWRNRWYPDAGEEAMMWDDGAGAMVPMNRRMERTLMMTQDLGEADDEFDKRFLDAMIAHHEGALAMTQEMLENGNRPRLKQMAEEVAATQQQNIDQMKQWRQSWYGS